LKERTREEKKEYKEYKEYEEGSQETRFRGPSEEG
jgi:hypothetical protein